MGQIVPYRPRHLVPHHQDASPAALILAVLLIGWSMAWTFWRVGSE